MCYKRLPEEERSSGFLRCPVVKTHIVSIEEYYSHVQRCREPYLRQNRDVTALERFMRATRSFFRRLRTRGRYDELENEPHIFAMARETCQQKPGTPRPQRNILEESPNFNADVTSSSCTSLSPIAVQIERHPLNSMELFGTIPKKVKIALSDLEEVLCEEYPGHVTSTTSSSNPNVLPEKTEKVSIEDTIQDLSIPGDSKTASSRVSLGPNSKDLENEASSTRPLSLETKASSMKLPIPPKLVPILIATNLDTSMSSDEENFNTHMIVWPTSPKVTFIEPVDKEHECKKDKEEGNEVLHENADVDVVADVAVENDLEDKIKDEAEDKVDKDVFEDATDYAVENEDKAKVQADDEEEKDVFADCEVENDAGNEVVDVFKDVVDVEIENKVEKDDFKVVTEGKVEPEKPH